MYFEVANTPESVKKQRRVPSPKPEPVEERPCLSLAPFSRPPLVLFENVPIGSSVERQLDVVNPTKRTIQLSMGRAPPPGLLVCLPESQLELAPQQGCSVSLRWIPHQPAAQRETIHFTDQYRGRYEVILVLKTIVVKPIKKGTRPLSKIDVVLPNPKTSNLTEKVIKPIKKLKGRRSPPKKIGVISPNPRIIKASKKVSPKILLQKKSSNLPVTRIHEYVTETLVATNKRPLTHRMYSDKENLPTLHRHSSSSQRGNICPFESLTSIDSTDSFNLNTLTTSDMFGLKGTNYHSYSEDISGVHKLDDDSYRAHVPFTNTYRRGILSTSTRHNTDMVANAIDNLTFTPLKSVPKIKITKEECNNQNNAFENNFVDSIEMEKKIDDETHSIILVKSHDENDFQANFIQPGATNLRLDFNFSVDESSVHSKKIPNTSSPKQFNSPAVNFTMNTDFSHITDTTFFPQRCSTERKILLHKGYHEDQETPHSLEKSFRRLSSDTYTKPDSPHIPVEPEELQTLRQPYMGPFIQPQSKPLTTDPKPKQLHIFERPTPQLTGRQTRNCGDNVRSIIEANLWQPEKSPPRSMTPPLQSIPEESTQFSISRIDRTNPAFHTFTINRTFDHTRDSLSSRRDSITTWKKKAARCEPNLWKQPTLIKETFRKTDTALLHVLSESINNISTNSALHHITDVYTQSSTVDPFLSSTYFYDEEAVDKFEREFKRWLNYILTPPADLDSNLDDQTLDVGRIWTENRNKEIPLAPTREEVSSKYHNSHRLESVRKSARALMLSPYMIEVFKKLNAQIDRKLISMRPDKNLPMDVGLQKTILALLLCYNPLWLRIGLETLYGTVIPLTSNSDVYGLTTFILQRVFKDPYMKNKHTHPHVPNMLLPPYMDYMRKFTLKKYFMLVFFLDQAKQKKLIIHDPCLFCRNSEYKESRDLLIQFTKELIAGIGDITKHLRPLGYVVSHKQNFLDEYKYAVQNLALDLKDGIRLSRVMEIILVKPGLMSYMRTPPVSRLQKIHNVQVALTALKDSNYNIVGDITAKDIADGHREKTLSLLWQIIHVFRAPLFEKASIVIQMWWKKKYLGIIIEKRIQHKKEMKKDNAASVIQCWWRRIQYQRLVDKNMKELQAAAIVVQKYWRMWICRDKFLKYKRAIKKIETWYKNTKDIKQAEEILRYLLLRQRCVARIQLWFRRLVRARRIMIIHNLYVDYCIQTRMRIHAANTIKQFLKHIIMLRKFRNIVSAVVEANKMEKQKNTAAIKIQNAIKSWLCRRKYSDLREKVITCQAVVRGLLVRRQQANLLHHVLFTQRTFRSKILMLREQSSFTETKQAAIVLQSHYKMLKQRRYYVALKTSVRNIEHRYMALLKMRRERRMFLQLKASVITVQKYRRAIVTRRDYIKKRQSIISLQRRYRAHLAMTIQREYFIKLKNSIRKIENSYIALVKMRKHRHDYLKLKISAVIIQKNFRSAITRQAFLKKKNSVINLQRRFRANMAMKRQRNSFTTMVHSTMIIQRHFRSYIMMKNQRQNYLRIKTGVIKIQIFIRAVWCRRKERENYQNLKNATTTIQRRYRARLNMKRANAEYVALKQACLTIQSRYRAFRAMHQECAYYNKLKMAAISIQQWYRAIQSMRKDRQNYNSIRNASITVQKRFRANCTGKAQRTIYLKLRNSTMIIQQRFREKKIMQVARHHYVKLKVACLIVQTRFRANLQMKCDQQKYLKLKNCAILVQRFYRAKLLGKKCRENYVKLKRACIIVQNIYRARCAMRVQRGSYNILKCAALTVQKYYRANKLRQIEMTKYTCLKNACVVIQRRFKAQLEMICCRTEFLKIRATTIIIQRRYRAKLAMKKCSVQYQRLRHSVTAIQNRFRANLLMKEAHNQYLKQKLAANKIKLWYKACTGMCKQRNKYRKIVKAVRIIQCRYRAQRSMISAKNQYMRLKWAVTLIQQTCRAKKDGYMQRQRYLLVHSSVTKIKTWYKSCLTMRKQRQHYLQISKAVRIIQIRYRAQRSMLSAKNHYMRLKWAVTLIQQTRRAKKVGYMQRQRYLLVHSSVTKIKTWYKSCLTMRKQRQYYLQISKAVRIIQIRFRAQRFMLQARNEFMELKQAATRIQQKYRAKKAGYLYRQRYLLIHKSVTKIQSWYRSINHMRIERLRYIEMKECKRRTEAAKIIQLWYRSIQCMTETRNQFTKMRKSVIKIQAMYRMRIIKRNYIQIRSSAVYIQTIYRSYRLGKIVRGEYLCMRTAAIKIQSAWRCWRMRQNYLQIRKTVHAIQTCYRRRKWLDQLRSEKQNRLEAIICIQKYYRRYLCLKEYRCNREKIIFIQRRWRQIIFARKSSYSMAKARNAIVKVQAFARGHLARRRVRLIQEEITKKREQERQHRAASKIQALFRANRVREQMKHRPAVAVMRQRLIRSEPVPREETMESQNEYALDVLTHYRDIPSIIRAFVIIEYLTEVYPMIYHKTCNRVAVSLLNYMMMTNRSVSTLDTVRPAAAILVNMARYKNTALIIYSREKMSNVLKLILRWSSQDSQYYRSLCTFLWLFGKYQHLRKDLKEFLQEPENRNMMHLIRVGVLRKQRMKDNVAKHKTYTPKSMKVQSKCRVHVNMSCCTDCASSSTPVPSMPALEPDYGFKKPDKLRYFENDLHAIDSLFHMYDIPLK